MPEWLDRLRTGTYTSPNGITSSFKFDILSRNGGKKASIHEILNSDDAVIQDQGNRVKSYPMNVYFVGDNGDTEADTFVRSLEENYSPDNPGILKHPRWGDINVIPFEFTQSENYVKGAGIFRVTVDFKESIPLKFPGATGLNESEIVANIDTLNNSVDSANELIDVTNPSRYAEFRQTINEVVKIVVDSVDSVAGVVKSIDDEFRSIQDDIDYALSIGTTALEVMSMVNNLIRLPAQIESDTLTKVQSYATMIEPMITLMTNKVNPKINRVGQINNAIMLQSLTTIATSSVAEASLFTELETRDSAGTVIDFINDSQDSVLSAVMETAKSLSEDSTIDLSFAPDHDTFLYLGEVVGQSNTFLVNKSFDLKAKKTTILTAPIDALSLCYKLYGTIDQLEFLIKTNKLTDNDIIEMPRGMEIVSYA